MKLTKKDKGLFIFLMLFFALILINTTEVSAQEKTNYNKSRHKLGFQYGIGNQNLLNLNYKYEVHLYQIQYYYSFKIKETWCFEIIIQPQFNTTKFRRTGNIENQTIAYEIGANAGILFRKYIFDQLNCYTFISSGPQYVSDMPDRQSDGFIISNNLFVGMNIKLYNNVFIDMRFGFRHISNANLLSPNRGIHNMIYGIGLLANL